MLIFCVMLIFPCTKISVFTFLYLTVKSNIFRYSLLCWFYLALVSFWKTETLNCHQRHFRWRPGKSKTRKYPFLIFRISYSVITQVCIYFKKFIFVKVDIVLLNVSCSKRVAEGTKSGGEETSDGSPVSCRFMMADRRRRAWRKLSFFTLQS